jgi:hypothetical protein
MYIKQSDSESAIPNFTASSKRMQHMGSVFWYCFTNIVCWVYHMTVLPKYREAFHQGQILVQEEEQQHMWRYRFCEALARGVQKSQAAATKQAAGGTVLDSCWINLGSKLKNMSLDT